MTINFKIILLCFLSCISFYSNAQLEVGNVAEDNNLFGVIDADSNWVIQPKYSSYDYLFNHNIDRVTGYIFQIEGKHIDVYNTNYEQTHRFKTKDYLLRGNYYNDGHLFLFLKDENNLSIYNLFIDDYIIRDKALKIYNNDCCQQVDGNIYFFVEDFSGNILIINDLGENLFQIAKDDSINVLPILGKKVDQLILSKTYLDKDNNVTKVVIQNMNGAVISIDEGKDSRDYYLEYHQKTKTFFLISHKAIDLRDSIITKVYNEDFSLNRITYNRVKTFGSFYASYRPLNKNKFRYNIYVTPDSLALSFTSDGHGLKTTATVSSAFAKTDSGYILLNESTLSSPIVYYINRPIYLGQKNHIMMIKSYIDSEPLVDVYSPSGELILDDWTYKSVIPRYGSLEYYYFEKSDKQLQLTKQGTIEPRK